MKRKIFIISILVTTLILLPISIRLSAQDGEWVIRNGLSYAEQMNRADSLEKELELCRDDHYWIHETYRLERETKRLLAIIDSLTRLDIDSIVQFRIDRHWDTVWYCGHKPQPDYPKVFYVDTVGYEIRYMPDYYMDYPSGDLKYDDSTPCVSPITEKVFVTDGEHQITKPGE